MTARPGLGAGLDRHVLEERRRALRALLRRPLLTADGHGADDLALVRRHASWLRDWLMRYPGWVLQVDSELARLRKTPARLDDGSRPAREPGPGGAPFSRRRYVLLCLAVAALERSERQTTLGALAQAVLRFAAGDPALADAGVAFDLDSRGQRRDLVQVVRLLLDLRVLARVHGDEQGFVDGRGDALYNIHRPALSALLDVRRGPSTLGDLDFDQRLRALTEEPEADTPEARNRRLRARLVRRLLDDPVVYYDELDDDELAYLQSQRGHLAPQVHEATGLVAEVRAEGLAMVDEGGALSDVGLPTEGTDGHLTLLIAEHLAAHARAHGDAPLGHAALERHTATLIETHRRHWRKDVTEPGAEVDLARHAVDRLVALGLARRVAGGVVARPAIGRYALEAPETPA